MLSRVLKKNRDIESCMPSRQIKPLELMTTGSRILDRASPAWK